MVAAQSAFVTGLHWMPPLAPPAPLPPAPPPPPAPLPVVTPVELALWLDELAGVPLLDEEEPAPAPVLLLVLLQPNHAQKAVATRAYVEKVCRCMKVGSLLRRGDGAPRRGIRNVHASQQGDVAAPGAASRLQMRTNRTG